MLTFSKVAFFASSIASIFCAGLSCGQPTMFAWWGLSSTGSAMTFRGCSRMLDAFMLAQPNKVLFIPVAID